MRCSSGGMLQGRGHAAALALGYVGGLQGVVHREDPPRI